MALTLIQQVRLNVQDNIPGLYIISDDEITYLLEKFNNNVDKASYQAAKIILLNLAQRSDETIDVFSIKGSNFFISKRHKCRQLISMGLYY